MMLPMLVLDAPHARASLRAEVVRAAAGKPFLAAVEIDTDAHWHVYWRNPGDSGIPTTIEWHAPKGWRVEPLEYPTPRRFTPGGIAAYGYEGRTSFLARITPSAASGELLAKVKWLVCANACVAGSASPSARIEVGTKEARGPQAAALRAAVAALPHPAAGWTAQAMRGAKAITLVVGPSDGRSQATGAEFFPEETGMIDHAKDARATFQGGRFVFKMDASPFPESRNRLKGLIVFSGGHGGTLIVDPKLESEKKP